MNKIYTTLFLTMVVTIIGLLNWLDTPTMSDDVMYRFVWQETLDAPLKRIENISDVVRSQITHYHSINGRSITHSLAQIVLNIIPDSIAKLLNTSVFLLFIYLVTVYTAVNRQNRLFVAVVTFGLIFIVISGFYTGFIWLLGAFTYLWALVFSLCFLILLRWLKERRMNRFFIPLIPLSFLMGWSHEAIALPLSIAFFSFILLNRKECWNKANTYCMIAYIIGMLMIVSSPALWFRANIEGIPLTTRIVNGCINILFGVRISWLMIVILALLCIFRNNIFKIFIIKHVYMLIAWITALIIVFTCGTSIERVPICADFIALLIVLDILQYIFKEGFKKILMLTICIACSIIAIPAIAVNLKNYNNFLYHHQQLCQQNNKLIKVRQLSKDMNPIVKRYYNPTIEFSFYNCYMAFDYNDVNNKAVASLYNKDKIICLPEDVIERIENDNNAFQKVESDKNHNLFILKLKNQHKVEHVEFILGKEIPLKFYQRIFSYKGNKYELDSFKYEVVKVHDGNYLVMTIPTSIIKRRIKAINIK